MKTLLLLQLFISLVLATDPSRQDKAPGYNPLSESEESQVSESQMDFAVRIYQKLLMGRKPPQPNLVISPISIYTTLSMLALGARATTHDEIFLSLGLDETMKDKKLHEGNRKILQALRQQTKGVEFKLDNEIFTDKSANVLQDYRRNVARYYNATFHSISFSDPQNAEKTINEIVSDGTDQQIQNMVNNLDSKTSMVLLDYTVFRGKWYKEFDRKLTGKRNFRVTTEKNVEVTMLCRPGLYKAYVDSKMPGVVVKVPYAGDLSLLLIIPQLGNLHRAQNSLTSLKIKKYLRLMRASSLVLYIPKISINQPVNLKQSIMAMGMRSMFGGEDTNFSGISANKKLNVSDIYHQSYFSIDEGETEASSATAVQLDVSLPNPIVMADHPFMFIIYHQFTETILWIGQVTDPTQ